MSKNLDNQEIVKTNTILSVNTLLLLLFTVLYTVLYVKKFLCTYVLFVAFITNQTITKSDNAEDENKAREID